MGTGLDDTGLYKWYGWFCRWAGRTLSLMGVAAPMHAEPESDWRGVLGRRGEDEAAAYLRQQGYRIVARRARVLRGDIDIVAVDGRTVVFVEVRSGTGSSAASPNWPPPTSGGTGCRTAMCGSMWLR